MFFSIIFFNLFFHSLKHIIFSFQLTLPSFIYYRQFQLFVQYFTDQIFFWRARRWNGVCVWCVKYAVTATFHLLPFLKCHLRRHFHRRSISNFGFFLFINNHFHFLTFWWKIRVVDLAVSFYLVFERSYYFSLTFTLYLQIQEFLIKLNRYFQIIFWFL